jgi:hypothetical protein
MVFYFWRTCVAKKRKSLPFVAFMISNILFRFYVSQSIFTIFLKYLETWRYFWLFKTLLYVCQNFLKLKMTNYIEIHLSRGRSYPLL